MAETGAAKTYGLAVDGGGLPPARAFGVFAKTHGSEVSVGLAVGAVQVFVLISRVDTREGISRSHRRCHGLSLGVMRTGSP